MKTGFLCQFKWVNQAFTPDSSHISWFACKQGGILNMGGLFGRLIVERNCGKCGTGLNYVSIRVHLLYLQLFNKAGEFGCRLPWSVKEYFTECYPQERWRGISHSVEVVAMSYAASCLRSVAGLWQIGFIHRFHYTERELTSLQQAAIQLGCVL